MALVAAGCAPKGQDKKPPGPAASLPVPPAADLAQLVADFRRACPFLLRDTGRQGPARSAGWAPACADPEPDPQAFIARHFQPTVLGDGAGLVTGYYEPHVPAALAPAPGLVPVLGRPLEGACAPGACPTRAEIESGVLSGRAPVLAWADPIDLFFLQVQGSGVLRFPDGRVQPVGFAGHNHHPYVGIGRLLRERGILSGAVGMAEIRAWLAAHPEAGRALMQENPRYIFFAPRAPDAAGPLGTAGVPLAPRRAIAIDPAFVPLGAPAWLETRIDGMPWAGWVLALDTGAAIRGANRVDLFLGSGDEAGAVAGRLQSEGRIRFLLPKPISEPVHP